MSNTSMHKLPMGQKIAFGLGMLANQMLPAVMGIFMVVLVQDLNFPGWMWGIIFFLPRVFDSITDPLMGYISDNTRSKWGRRRQYVFIGSILMGIAFVVMWQLYRDNGVNYNFIYFLSWSFVFYLGLTIFSVPYVAMGYEMSDDFHERTNIMAIAQWIGQWAWVIAPWFWVIMYDKGWFSSADVATRTLAVWVGIFCMILAMIPAIFIKSKSTLEEDYEPLSLRGIGGSLMSILNGFKEALKIKDFRKLCIATFLIFNAFNTVATFTFFIIVYHLFSGDAGAAGIWPTLFGSVGALITTFLVIPVVAWMSKKLGKKKAFITSQGLSILGYILLWFLLIPGKPYMFIFALPFFSFGIGSLFTLMMSMTADVLDLDELNSGKRREGIFGAIYWWMVKFGFAIAGLLSGAIITLVGFDAGLAEQPEGAITGLRAFFSGLPIVGTLIAMYVMKDYEITEERATEISAALKLKKAEGHNSVPPVTLSEIVSNRTVSPLDTDLKEEMSLEQVRNTYHSALSKGMHGICFSVYSENEEPGDLVSKVHIEKRMELIRPYTRWVRSFSCTNGHEHIPVVAKEKGLLTMAGAWLSSDLEKNEIEINSLIKLVENGYVDIAVLGNEVLMRKDLSEDQIIDYLKKLKKALPNSTVGYADAYYIYHHHPALIDVCDVILVNCYPFWEGSSIKEATANLDLMYSETVKLARNKKVIITETGWPGAGENKIHAVPGIENAMRYFVNVQAWAGKNNVETFYFSSFDEPWKVHHEGLVGSNWGIWNVKEKLKYT